MTFLPIGGMTHMSDVKKKKNWKRTLLIVLCVVLSLVLILVAAAGVGLNYFLERLGYATMDTTVPHDIAESIAKEDWEEIDPEDDHPIYNEEDVTFNPGDVDHEGQGDHIINIMLVGQDAREGEGTQRSDSMILATINKNTKTITLTSFMRDQYVQIPGYGNTKLCHAYSYGGMSLLNETLYNHFGIEIDGNLEVDFVGFEKIINLLGGVDIELTKAEVKYLRNAGGWDLSVGMNRMPGDAALLYSRLRSIDTDYMRAERQRKVLISLLDAYKEKDPNYAEALVMMNEILPYIKTNMSKSEITNYAAQLFPILTSAKVETLRIPVDGTFEGGYIKVSEGMKLWCQLNIDFEANRKVLDEIFAE